MYARTGETLLCVRVFGRGIARTGADMLVFVCGCCVQASCAVLKSGSLSGKTVEDAWCCPDLQQSLFQKIEGGLLQKLAKKLAAASKAGVPQYDAWQSNLTLITRIAAVHTDRLAFEAFQAEVKEVCFRV